MGHASRATAARRIATGVLDRLGRPIRVGDQITWSMPVPLIMQVVKIEPDLRSQAPAGGFILSVVAPITTGVLGGQPMPQILLVCPKEDLDEEVEAPPNGNGPGLVLTDLEKAPDTENREEVPRDRPDDSDPDA